MTENPRSQLIIMGKRNALTPSVLSVLAGGNSLTFQKGTVEGPQGIEAHLLADLGDGLFALRQELAGGGYAKGIDLIVKSDVKLTAQHVRNVILAQVKILFQHGKGKVLVVIADAIVHDHAKKIVVTGLNVV